MHNTKLSRQMLAHDGVIFFRLHSRQVTNNPKIKTSI